MKHFMRTSACERLRLLRKMFSQRRAKEADGFALAFPHAKARQRKVGFVFFCYEQTPLPRGENLLEIITEMLMNKRGEAASPRGSV